MNESDTTSSALPEQATQSDELRWPDSWTLVTSWLMPARSAQRTGHVSLRSAYLLHLLTALFGVALIVSLAVCVQARAPLSPASAVYALMSFVEDMIQECVRQGWLSVGVVCAVALGIELGFACLAFLLMPWGARDEPIRSSFRHALRRTWLQTPHLLVGILLVGTLAIALHQAELAWPGPDPWPPYPTQPENAAPFSQESLDYREAVRQYHEQVEAYWEKRPWYVKFQEGIVALSVMIVAVWGLWALLRAVGAARSVLPIDRPPMCGTCGYNLTTIAMDSRCPECGEPVAESLGPDVRPGTAWEHARGTARLSAWWHCTAEAIRNPTRLGRRLRLSPPGADHRRLWLLHLPVLFVLAPFFFVACISIVAGPPPRDDVVEFAAIAVPVFGSMGAAGLFFFGLFVVLVQGLPASLRHKRNLLPYAMQVTSYLSGFFVLWMVFAGVWGVVVVIAEGYWFRALERLVSIDNEVLAFFAWFLPNAACAVWYFVLVGRGTAATRYANR